MCPESHCKWQNRNLMQIYARLTARGRRTADQTARCTARSKLAAPPLSPLLEGWAKRSEKGELGCVGLRMALPDGGVCFWTLTRLSALPFSRCLALPPPCWTSQGAPVPPHPLPYRAWVGENKLMTIYYRPCTVTKVDSSISSHQNWN